MNVARPEELGFDAARLARVDAWLDERYLQSGRLAHAQILIARDGEIAHFATMGAAREDGSPLGEDAIFRIASMTKSVTSVAYMMLLEQGLTALDDPVSRVVPDFGSLGAYAGGGGGVPFASTSCRPMRMIDLLRHTSGLTYGFQNRTNIDAAYREHGIDGFKPKYDNDGFIAALARLPLEFEPGAAWNYSVATDVLGFVVARLSGMTLGDYLRTHIFEPLGMVDTAFQCPEGKRNRLTDAWMLHPKRGRVPGDRAENSAWCAPPVFESGGGGLVSTTADYHRFCAMLLGGGALDGARILSPKTLALMTVNHLPDGKDLTQMSKSLFSEAGNAGTGFGLGFAVTLDPARTLLPGTAGEYYWGGMYSTAFFVDPVERLSMVFMTQLMPSSAYPIRRELKTLIYSALTHSHA